jgi:hypothetical protein
MVQLFSAHLSFTRASLLRRASLLVAALDFSGYLITAISAGMTKMTRDPGPIGLSSWFSIELPVTTAIFQVTQVTLSRPCLLRIEGTCKKLKERDKEHMRDCN